MEFAQEPKKSSYPFCFLIEGETIGHRGTRTQRVTWQQGEVQTHQSSLWDWLGKLEPAGADGILGRAI